MKGKSDCSRGWKPEKAPGRALPASLSSCLSHALKKLRQSDRGQSEWGLQLGNGQIMNLTSNAFVQREGSGNRFGWCRHRGEKRLGCRPRLPSSKPNQGTTSSAGIMIFQLLDGSAVFGGWVGRAGSGCSHREENWALTVCPRVLNTICGMQRLWTPAPTIECPLAPLWASLDRDNVRIRQSRGPIHQ